MTTSTVPSEKLEQEAVSVYFLKILPEPVERKLETEADFCVLGEKHILYAFQSPNQGWRRTLVPMVSQGDLCRGVCTNKVAIKVITPG